jgi:hypothetical protein
MVPDHLVNYGSRYVPSWQFDQLLKPLLDQPRAILDGLAPPMLPARLRYALPVARGARSMRRRLGRVFGKK